MTPEEQAAFFSSLSMYAQSTYRRWKGMRPSCCLAQAGLETGYGSRVIGKANYWGIKTTAWIPGKIAVSTHEWNPVTKQMDPKTLWFADFPTLQDGFDAYGRLVSHNPVYEIAREQIDLSRYVEELSKHWASDPNYAGKVMLEISQFNLSQYDSPL